MNDYPLKVRTDYEHFDAHTSVKNKNTEPQPNFSGSYKKRVRILVTTEK